MVKHIILWKLKKELDVPDAGIDGRHIQRRRNAEYDERVEVRLARTIVRGKISFALNFLMNLSLIFCIILIKYI